MNKSFLNIYIVILACLIGLAIFGVYTVQTYVTGFSNRSADIHGQLQKFEESRNTIELYRKILAEGSKEQAQIDSYILTGDEVFKAITDIEKDGKKIKLFTSGGILSVTKRDTEALQQLHAGEVVVQISVEGDVHDVDLYIKALANLPYASYLEKVSLTFSDQSSRAKADITLIITESL